MLSCYYNSVWIRAKDLSLPSAISWTTAPPDHPELCSPGNLLRNNLLRECNPGVTEIPATPSSGRTRGCRATDAIISYDRVRKQPSHHLSVPEPSASHPSSVFPTPFASCPPRESQFLTSPVLLADPGSRAGHAPVSRLWCPQTPRVGVRNSRLPSSQASRKHLRSAGLDLNLTGLSAARGRPAQH
ncbi:hypothetical protein HispidOSU_004510 [Sigmodon hispidus]